jgi:hypothetical protein
LLTAAAGLSDNSVYPVTIQTFFLCCHMFTWFIITRILIADHQ